MSDEIIVKHCSPTLAGLKTGNMFLVSYESTEQVAKDIRSINKRLGKKGLRMIPVHYNDGNRVLIYLYRPSYLKKDLEKEEALKLLKEMGYDCTTPEEYLTQLIRNYDVTSQIPHEIGLFLSYPPEDVRGFIENKAANCKCLGTWKVYGDEEKAKKTFGLYEKCSTIYYNQWRKGKSIERLTVAV